MLLLALSTMLDYTYGFWVASTNRKKAYFFVWLSVLNNIGILAIFKYYNFFAIQFQNSLEILGIQTSPFLLNVALPVGISFYTFHGLSYVFDIYNGRQKPIINLIDYSVFVSFFPLLVAGPIERANHLLPQVQKRRYFSYLQAIDGSKLILWGLFKKILIADALAPAVNDIFNNYTNYSGGTLVLGAIYFSFQIYCDFSGYSDIARGIAKLFGFELLVNFNRPYLSRSIPEFWRRWHMSLSSWFRDYLYIPLGGSRSTKLISIRNIFIIFLVSGLWHGANWTFIAWGGIHAMLFMPSFLLKTNRENIGNEFKSGSWYPTFYESMQIVFTFALVTVAWVFFRSATLHQSIDYLYRCLLFDQNIEFKAKLFVLLKYLFFSIILFLRWEAPIYRIVRIAIYYYVLWDVFLNIFKPSDFIYFQF